MAEELKASGSKTQFKNQMFEVRKWKFGCAAGFEMNSCTGE